MGNDKNLDLTSCCGVDLTGLLVPELFKSLADPVRLQVVSRLVLAREP